MGSIRHKFDDINDLLNKYGNAFAPCYDGRLYRFSPPGNLKKSGWYVSHQSGDLFVVMAGDFREGDDFDYWSNKKRFTQDDSKAFEDAKKELAEKIKKEREEYSKKHKSSNAKALRNEVETDGLLTTHDYLRRKRIDQMYCAKFIDSPEGIMLVIPMIDEAGEVWNYQRIYNNGQKLYAKGRSIGLYNVIHVSDEVCYVCEGFATAVSVHKATGKSVVIAFSAGNIVPVIENIKLKYKHIIVCADNDAYGETNTGIEAAEKARRIHKTPYIYPTFVDVTTKPTDFNDLELLEGIGSVKSQIIKEEVLDVDYDNYKRLFEHHLRNPRMCIFDKILLADYNGKETVVENKITALKGHAASRNLKLGQMEPFLYKWMDTFNERLLLDIKPHDGEDYIGGVLKFVSVKNVTNEQFVDLMKQWFANIWARFYDPKAQNVCPILKGDQGLGKDTLLSNMLSGFGKYFEPNFDVNDRPNEMYQIMYRKMILNISEFDRTARHDVATLKKIITSTGAFFRPPYARKAEHFDFRCSFISSSNKLDVLLDNTGNRRYWLFDLDDIDWSYPKGLEDKIMWQAHELYRTKHKASHESINAITEYVKGLTPDSDDDIEMDILEIWTQRAKQLIEMNKNGQYFGPKFSGYKIPNVNATPIIDDIAKLLGVTPFRVRNLLKRNRYSGRDKTSRFYTYDAMLSGEN